MKRRDRINNGLAMALVAAGVIKQATPRPPRNAMRVRGWKTQQRCRAFQVRDRHDPDKPLFRINY